MPGKGMRNYCQDCGARLDLVPVNEYHDCPARQLRQDTDALAAAVVGMRHSPAGEAHRAIENLNEELVSSRAMLGLYEKLGSVSRLKELVDAARDQQDARRWWADNEYNALGALRVGAMTERLDAAIAGVS